ncbi:MAG: ABC transporter permease [Deltaproteobacteria bacterium]|nr:ABC transporter permease [Deltaproteobacteria bacterium]
MTPTVSPVRNRFSRFRLQLGLTAMFLALLGLFMITSPQAFLSWRIYVSFLSTIPFSALLALGLTLLIIAGEMDLSFPSVMAVTGLAFSWCFQETGSTSLAFFMGLFTGVFAGLINGLIVVKIGVPSIVATIGMQFFWRGLATLLSDGLALSLVPIRETAIREIFVGRIAGLVPAQAIWCVILAIGLWFLLNRHVFGDHIFFIGDNSRTAQSMGIPVDFTKIMLFVLMGLFAALTSVMVCLEMANWWPTHGDGYLLLVFAAVFIGGNSVFGGQGTIYGTMIGACIIGILEAGIISSGWSGYWTRLIYGVIIVVCVSIYALGMKMKNHRG